MFKEILIFGIGLLGILTILWITVPAQNLAWAASITCVGSTCMGTIGNDIIKGGSNAENINGIDGNDNINSGDGDDKVCGGRGIDKIDGAAGDDRISGDSGNDKIDGAAGDDRISGDWVAGDSLLSFCGKWAVGPLGADTINGGPGNDIITQGNAWNIHSDDQKDVINCGPGDDTVFIDTKENHDVAINCEHINPS